MMCFNRINPDLVSPINFWGYLACFNRINPDRSIPTLLVPKVNNFYKLFQSYQSRQINPDPLSPVILVESVMCFNRINPNRSIPTITTYDPYALKILFQSYQSKQINPDEFGRLWLPFSRGVSIVSIQTDQSRIFCDEQKYREALELQSYQSRQINPDSYLCWASRGVALRCRMAEPVFWKIGLIKIYTTYFVYNLINKFSNF